MKGSMRCQIHFLTLPSITLREEEEIFANLPLFRENFFRENFYKLTIRENFFREKNKKFSFTKISSAKKFFPKKKDFFVGRLFFKRFFKKHLNMNHYFAWNYVKLIDIHLYFYP